METTKRKTLQAAGWKVGDAADFLEMSDEERQLLDARMKLARETLVVWVADPTISEESSPPTALSKLLRKKNSNEKPKSTLMLLITPSVVSEEVATAPQRR